MTTLIFGVLRFNAAAPSRSPAALSFVAYDKTRKLGFVEPLKEFADTAFTGNRRSARPDFLLARRPTATLGIRVSNRRVQMEELSRELPPDLASTSGNSGIRDSSRR